MTIKKDGEQLCVVVVRCQFSSSKQSTFDSKSMTHLDSLPLLFPLAAAGRL